MGQITGNDELLTKGDLQDYHERILPYLNGVTAIDNTFDVSNLYSTEEKMIGQWIDGKPLYQKTIQTTFGAVNTFKYVDIGASIESVADLQAFCNFNGAAMRVDTGIKDAVITSTQTNYEGSKVYIGTNTDANNRKNQIILVTNVSIWANQPVYVIMRYTKTTDSAMTVPFGSVNDYSTTERVVGTWIDGKPLYQRVVQGTTGNESNTWYTLANLGSTCVIRRGECWVITSTSLCPIPFGLSDIRVTYNSDTKNGAITFNLGNNVSVTYSRPIYAIVQYTKTTD